MIPNVLGRALFAPDPRIDENLQRSRELGQEALSVLGQLGRMEAPQPVRPAYRTEDALGLLVAGLLSGGGRELAPLLEGFMQGKQAKAAQDTQAANIRFANEREGVEQRASLLGQQSGLARQAAEDLIQGQSRRDAALQQAITREADRAQRKEIADADRLAREESARNANRIRYGQLVMRATRPAQFEAILTEALDNGVRFSPEEINAMRDELKVNWAKQANDEWGKEKARLYTSLGMPSSQDLDNYETKRQALIKTYGLTDDDLIPLTGTTPLKQQNWKEAFAYKKDQEQKTLSARMAEVANESARIGIARERLALDMQKFGNATAIGNYERNLKFIESSSKAKMAPLQAEIKDLTSQITRDQNRVDEITKLLNPTSKNARVPEGAEAERLKKQLFQLQADIDIKSKARYEIQKTLTEVDTEFQNAKALIPPPPVVAPVNTPSATSIGSVSAPKGSGELQPLPLPGLPPGAGIAPPAPSGRNPKIKRVRRIGF